MIHFIIICETFYLTNDTLFLICETNFLIRETLFFSNLL